MIEDDRNHSISKDTLFILGKIASFEILEVFEPSFGCPQRLDPFPPILFHFQDGTLKNLLNDAFLFFLFFFFCSD